MFHVAFAARNGCNRVVVCASDTDIIVLCMYHLSKIPGLQELWIWKFANEFIPVHVIAEMLDPAFVNALPAIHAISGCDTTSRLYKRGKKSAVLQDMSLCQGLAMLAPDGVPIAQMKHMGQLNV